MPIWTATQRQHPPQMITTEEWQESFNIMMKADSMLTISSIK